MKKTKKKLSAKADINKNKKIEPWEAARSKAIQKSMSKKKSEGKYERYLSRGLKSMSKKKDKKNG